MVGAIVTESRVGSTDGFIRVMQSREVSGKLGWSGR